MSTKFDDVIERFTQAQLLAMSAKDEVGEVIAIGLTELTKALQDELRNIRYDVQDLEKKLK